MTLHVENEISNYWKTSQNTPVHPVSSYISRDRFQELYIRVRLVGKEAKGPYEKVGIRPKSAYTPANISFILGRTAKHAYSGG